MQAIYIALCVWTLKYVPHCSAYIVLSWKKYGFNQLRPKCFLHFIYIAGQSVLICKSTKYWDSHCAANNSPNISFIILLFQQKSGKNFSRKVAKMCFGKKAFLCEISFLMFSHKIPESNYHICLTRENVARP